MIDWSLRILGVVAAFWLSHAYIVAASGKGLSPVSLEALRYSFLDLWRAARRGFDQFDWIILSPLAVGFVFVAVLAFRLVRAHRT